MDFSAKTSNKPSSADDFHLLVWIWRISSLSFMLGNVNTSSLSKRPSFLRVGSIASIRLVAQMMTTWKALMHTLKIFSSFLQENEFLHLFCHSDRPYKPKRSKKCGSKNLHRLRPKPSHRFRQKILSMVCCVQLSRKEAGGTVRFLQAASINTLIQFAWKTQLFSDLDYIHLPKLWQAKFCQCLKHWYK